MGDIVISLLTDTAGRDLASVETALLQLTVTAGPWA